MSENLTGAAATIAPGVPEWTLGDRLQRALRFAGMTMEDMADELGVHRTSVGRWINETSNPPRRAYLKQWALRTGVDYEWLATGTVDLTRPRTPDGQVIDGTGWFSRTAA